MQQYFNSIFYYIFRIFFCARSRRKELIFIGHWLLIDVSRKFLFLLIDRKMKKKKKEKKFIIQPHFQGTGIKAGIDTLK